MSEQQAFVDALLDPERPPPAGLSTWNRSDPSVRFAVYRNNVMVSLVDALADTFPVTQELVGDAFFRAMAQLFVCSQPPRSRLLVFYGEAFPDFIAQFPPAASVPYLADVARLEMLRIQAFHAADADALGAEAIALALEDPDRLPELVVGLHPSIRLFRSPYAVVSLWAAHQGILDIASVDPALPENALVLRGHLDVEVVRVSAGDGEFVASLLQGASFGNAAEQANALDADFDLAGILSVLIRQHAISSMTAARRTPS